LSGPDDGINQVQLEEWIAEKDRCDKNSHPADDRAIDRQKSLSLSIFLL